MKTIRDSLMSSFSLFHKVRKGVGVDRAVGYTLIGKGWGLTTNLVNLWLISHNLTKDEQGFYYTFSSILAIQIIFEMGFTTVLLQFASHEMASLRLEPDRTVNGKQKAKARLSSLLRLSMKWYGVVAALVVLTVIPSGLHFFSTTYKNGLEVIWETPWIILSIATAGLLFISPLTAIVEGTGQVAEIALMRVFQSFVSSIALWSALLLGLKLFAAPIFTSVSLLCAVTWLTVRHGAFFKDLLSLKNSKHVISWWEEIWPFQWKIAVSYMSGYISGQLYNPILFALEGPTIAGQMGMSVTIAGGITGIGLAWMNTKSAPFGRMIAKQDFRQLDQTFFRSLWQSLAIVTMACGGAFGVVLYLKHIHNVIGDRVLDTLPLALILVGPIISHIIFSEAIYLRAHKQEPLMWLSVAGAVLTGGSAYLVGKYYGVVGMCISSLFLTIVIGFGFGTFIFIKARKNWHS